MPRHNRPFQLPAGHRVEAMRPNGFKLSELTPAEKALFDSIASESVNIAGTPLEYYKWDRVKSYIDPLYGESPEKCWKGPYHFRAAFTWAEPVPATRPDGFQLTFRTQVWMARKDFEDNHCPPPDVSDAVRVWDIPFLDKFAVAGENVPNAGLWFDVIRVADDGHPYDSSDFVGFRLDLARHSEFTPERRIFPP